MFSDVSDSNGKPRALLFVRDGTLMEQPFDGARTTGDAVPTIDHVSYSASSASGAFRLSGTGDVLVFRPDLGGLNQMVWFDRNGRADGALAPPGAYGNPRVSPDGRRVLFSRTDDETGNRDLWYFDSANGAAQRLTTSPANDWQGVWSGDSRRILFTSDRGDEEARRSSRNLYVKSSLDPGAEEEPWWSAPNPTAAAGPVDWSRDGHWIALGRGVGGTGVWIDAVPTRNAPFAFLQTPFNDDSARFSPDGKWIAYVSNESGRPEVYVRPFAGKRAGEAKVRVSTGGGDFPVWRGDGTELYFIAGDMKIHAAATGRLGSSGIVGPPTLLFTACPGQLPAFVPLQNSPWAWGYDVTPDGQRFVLVCRLDAQAKFEVILDRRR